MTMLISSRFTRSLAVALTLGLSLGLVLPLISASPAVADTAPVDPSDPATPVTVSADALPTVQINGVAWAQVVVGDTVYVAGEFTTARPAGAAPGVNTVPRQNLLAYNIETGNLITSFAPSLNGQALAITASPDGSRIYVGGDFTTVNGAPYYRIAAISTATGQAIPSFRPIMGSQVRAISATNTTVYAGGTFQSVNSQTRRFLAAMNASDGSLTSWTADADAMVYAITLTKDHSKVIAGGRFAHVEGADHYGLVALDAGTGDTVSWAAPDKVRDAGPRAAIMSLHATEDRVYGSGYVFGSNEDGNLEGIFSADPDTGEIQWIEDCHGDTVSVWTLDDVVYGAGHPHFCGNIGGFPQTEPWTMHHTVAFSKAATGTVTPDPYGYFNWAGNPSPSLLNWFPDWVVGSYTGQGQAVWNLSGNDRYITAAGDFPYVNGTAQYGLTRFAIEPIAPNNVGPVVNPELVPTAASFNAGEVRVSWTATYDRDNTHLSYRVVRVGGAGTVYETTQDSNFWTRPAMGFIDTGLTPGQVVQYRVYASDPYGNEISRLGSPVTVSAENSAGPYSDAVAADNPTAFWPLDESSGGIGFDHVGFTDLQLDSGVSRGAPGAIDDSTASSFDGSGDGFGVTQSAIPGPDTFTAEAWIRTTSNNGGKIIGFGNQQAGLSTNYDRHVYMDDSGRIWFGAHPGGVRTVNSTDTFNDGDWHQVVASLGSNGMRLWVDGMLVGSRDDVTFGQGFDGYWRVGGDNLNGWTDRPDSNFLDGDIGLVSLYPTVLNRTSIVDHLVAAGRVSPIPPAPADEYGAAVYDDNPTLYWRLDETTGNTAADSGALENHGTYDGPITKGVSGALASGTGTAAGFSSPSGVSSNTQFNNPTTYSLETWFQTTTDSGGKLIGFGNQQTGLSSSYDRHLYMQDDGALVFGTWTGFANTITSPNPYNDGAWHHAVAAQSSNGMALYVDGSLVGTNSQNAAQEYSGYWRIGGDNTWGSTSPYFAGNLDEVAVYSGALSSETIAAHYALGSTGVIPNQAPAAAFSASVTDLSASFDASASSDPDGSISDYAWDFGDGTTGTGVNATHAYATAGDFDVTLTVTDNQFATGAVTHTVATSLPPVNQSPVAEFTSVLTGLSVSLDASTSSDPDGTIAGYAWDFGDGASGSGATVSHSYASPGDYTVTLTLADNDAATTVVDHVLAPTTTAVVPEPDHVVVVIMENKSQTQIIGNTDAPYINSLATDGALMTDSYGIVHPSQPNYFALFSGSLNGVLTNDCPNTFVTTNLSDQLTAAGKNFIGYAESLPSVGYEGCFNGDYQRKHNPWVNWPSVPDSSNQPFTSFPTDFTTLPTVSFVVPNLQHDMHDGTIAEADTWLQGALDDYVTWAKANNSLLVLTWDEDDGGVSNHIPTIFVGDLVQTGQYSQAIDHYDVLRTIQDAYGLPSNDMSAAASPIANIWSTSTPNVPPLAEFTSSSSGLTAVFDGSGSSDPDGNIDSYGWGFGDGQTAIGATPSHVYAAGGTYTVSLTVTDNQGATTTTTQDVTVTAPPANVVAQDTFGRTVSSGWGTADVGGSWTVTGNAASLQVDGGTGQVDLGAGSTRIATLPAVASDDTDSRIEFTLDGVPTGGGAYIDLIGRQVGSASYAAEIWVRSTGAVFLITKQGSTVLDISQIPGLTYTAGTELQLRFQVTGDSPTTLRAKVWATSGTEPAAWRSTVTDSASALQQAGAIALKSYLSSSATTPITFSYDNLIVNSSTAPTPTPNVAPVAAFTSSSNALNSTFDAATSSDSDGTIADYAWDFGDGGTADEVNPSHAYAADGTYTVQLTVTDNDGATNTVSHDVTVSSTPTPNVAPVAAFTSSSNALNATFDAATSSDSDGTINSYAWNFGDGASDTVVNPSHAYAADGTYTVQLTVTDNDGATNTVSHDVTVSTPVPPEELARADFETDSVNGWGSADIGGSWTHAGSASAYTASSGFGVQVVPNGSTKTSSLSGVSSSAVDLRVSFSADKPATGGGIYVSAIGRDVGSTNYQARVWMQASGNMRLQLLQGSTPLQMVIPGTLSYTPGTTYQLRLEVFGTSPTTIRAKVWADGQAEPANWQASVTDGTPALQSAGSVGLRSYVSSSATDIPVAVRFDNLLVRPQQ